MGGHACAQWATLPRFDCVVRAKSAYPPRLCVRADIAPVGSVPIGDLSRCSKRPSFDELVGAEEKGFRDRQPERFGGQADSPTWFPIDLFRLEEIRLWRAANPETFASRNGLY